MSYSLNSLYRVAGISKQAVSNYASRQAVFQQKLSRLLIEADALRAAHPGCGVEKMYHTLKPDFIGRDRFIETFMELGYRVKRKKNYRITTRGGDYYYPNHIAGLEVSGPNQVWQSDITYIRIKERFYYAVFIIDVFTKEIVGYSVSDHMRATANMHALEMALKRYPAPKYHHSDRGSQYLYHEYTGRLQQEGTVLSMGKIAQENAYAERVNGTIKNEFLAHWEPQNLEQLKRMVKKAVKYYNTKRPHQNIGYNTPCEFEKPIALRGPSQSNRFTIYKFENV